jgi:transcriptional regulator with XRE-family HTH domain
MADEWAKEMADRIGKAVRDLREPQSVQWLEDRTAELGHRVSRSTVNELENRRRKSVTLADVMVLAAALNVPVAHLIWPPDGPLAVEVLPGELVPRHEALESLAGGEADIQRDRNELNEAMRTISAAQETVRKLMARNGIAESWGTGPIKLDELHDEARGGR